MIDRITYEDFKIGQIVVCSKIPATFYSDALTIGKSYKIVDLDIHFPYAICVELNRGYCAFVDIKYFIDEVSELRSKKIDTILK